MKLAIILSVIGLAFASIHPVNEHIVSSIKSKTSNWKPMKPETNPFAYKSIEQIKGMLGYKCKKSLKERTILAKYKDMPESFDARTEWPEFIHQIRDQEQCGSCWAFAASEALSDRFTIKSAGKVDIVLSPQYQVSCDQFNYGCDGGYLDAAWIFLENTGIPSDECVPYTSGSGSSGVCPRTCEDGSKIKLFKASDSITLMGADSLKGAILSDGPVEVGFDVYEDFMNYESGVYEHVEGNLLGGHAVKAIGWGKEGDDEYWIMANSWAESWGEKGFFKIKFGECGIEDDINFGDAVITTLSSE